MAGSDEVIAFAGKAGYGFFNKITSKAEYTKELWTASEKAKGKRRLMRMNDGRVDSKGRFWAGAMCDPLETKLAPEGLIRSAAS